MLSQRDPPHGGAEIGRSFDPSPTIAAALLPHLDAAYNLARWLVRDESNAQDLVQEAYLRALRSAGTFRGGDAKAWLLTIVRNVAFDFLRITATRRQEPLEDDLPMPAHRHESEPQAILLRSANVELVRQAIESLPVIVREAIVLREMEGMSYREVAAACGVPIGTVMSRLARGRERLKQLLSDPAESADLSDPTAPARRFNS